MFDRSAKYSAPRPARPSIPAKLTLDNGSVLNGKFFIPENKNFHEILNGPASFLDFEQHTGERQLIAKSTIRSVNLISVPNARALSAPVDDRQTFDPHKILGLDKNADAQKIKDAYYRLSKIYHPDRHAGSALPSEVLDYLNHMSRRINVAFDALKDAALEPQVQKRPTPLRAQPVYTSDTRA